MSVIVITGKENIRMAQLMAWRSCLGLECKGLKRRGQSVFSIVKQELGFTGNKITVYHKLDVYINERMATAP
jgi:hypothetical protein